MIKSLHLCGLAVHIKRPETTCILHALTFISKNSKSIIFIPGRKKGKPLLKKQKRFSENAPKIKPPKISKRRQHYYASANIVCFRFQFAEFAHAFSADKTVFKPMQVFFRAAEGASGVYIFNLNFVVLDC